MSRRVNYRKRLARVIAVFLEGTPSSIKRAIHLLNGLPRPTEYALEGLIWSPFFAMLGDSAFFEDPMLLRQLQSQLEGTSDIIERLYINRDFRPEMTGDENEWYLHLQSLLEFLGGIGSTDDSKVAKGAEDAYIRRKADIAAIVSRLPQPERLGDELIYQFVLREVTAILTNMDVRLTVLRTGYLVPDGFYSELSAYRHPRTAPDASTSLAWSKTALRAIAGSGWLLMSWQFRGDALVLSLH
jgi:hypothetical protein